MEPVFRVLGPLQVTSPLGSLKLSAPRERVVLAQLVLNANRLVSVERLAEAVWGYSAPSTVRTQIQICVSRIRRSLEDIGLADRIQTVSPGYQLTADEAEVDLLVFERQAAEALCVIRQCTTPGPVSEAVVLGRRALRLFTAEPLLDVDSEVVQAKARHLAERRLQVLEECLKAELKLGQAADVVDETSRLVVENPLHGSLRVTQMKALQVLGRRADALATYQEGRRVYREHLGVEPDPELQRAYEAILRDLSPERGALTGPGHEPGRTARPSLGHGVLRRPTLNRGQLPPPFPFHLVARPTEARDLYTHLTAPARADVPPGMPRVVSISGMRGVGKADFAVASAHRLADDYPDAQLFADLGTEGGAPADEHEILAKLLGGLGVLAAQVPAEPKERELLYQRLVAERRVLVVLVNVDDARLPFLLIPRAPGCGVIVTSRVQLVPDIPAHRIRLGPLDPDASVKFLAQLIGKQRVAAEPDHARTLGRQCAGLPLALTALADRLKNATDLPLAWCAALLREERTRLDRLGHQGGDVRTAVRADYDELSPLARRLLCRLSRRHAEDFAPLAAEGPTGCGRKERLESLDELVERQLVSVRDDDGAARRQYRLLGLVHLVCREETAGPGRGTGRAVPRSCGCGRRGVVHETVTDVC
ncbi:BTAD domain-containing putative transcriptional regulator [Streptomyces sp. NPDC091279]|uniref:AfsR/SARP family transcriptional regulator n=1 Tax=Streptomyces sp. NPDC091279 TaxID=3365983 RepID=UPI00382788A8